MGIDNSSVLLQAEEFKMFKVKCVRAMKELLTDGRHRTKLKIVTEVVRRFYVDKSYHEDIGCFMELLDFVYSASMSESFAESAAKVIGMHFTKKRRRLGFARLECEAIVHWTLALMDDESRELFLRAVSKNLAESKGFHPVIRGGRKKAGKKGALKREKKKHVPWVLDENDE